MRKIYFRHATPLAIILLTLFFASCKTKSLQVQVLIPAQINVPQDINTIGLLNHSLPSKQDRWSNVLEGFLTGESIFADKEASYATLNGCANKLNNSPRFKSTVLTNEDYRGTGTKQFPLPLEWGGNRESLQEIQCRCHCCIGNV